MKSMTGYGHGETVAEGARVVIEIRSLNRKQAEVMLSVPGELEPLESRVRDVVNRVVARGRCDVRIAFEPPAGQAASRINRPLAAAFAAEWAAVAAELGLTGAAAVPSLELIARCPGVIQAETTGFDPDRAWPWVEAALTQALEAFDTMRRREGTALAADLSGRIDLLRGSLDRVAAVAPEVVTRYREQLLQRVRTALAEGIAPDDERLLKEVVLFADRCDISEEIARLRSHFEQFHDSARSPDAVGRKLDFLAQEMNREINTIGSKANDARIAAEVVAMKTELERFREQAQNIE
jgi:uncharacterized protein (TIGR00255 family)